MDNIKEKLAKIGNIIDDSFDNKDPEMIKECLDKLSGIECDIQETEDEVLFFYFTANAWASLYNLDKKWAWDSKEKEEEIYNLRKSLNALRKIYTNPTDILFRVKTNLANALNNVGRFAEAVELWDEVLEEYPLFSMAHGNKGYGLSWYAKALYDNGHQSLFLNQSRKHLLAALRLDGLESHAVEGFTQTLERIESYADWDSFDFSYKQESFGRSKKEKRYRLWSLENRLFLNPLNDTEILEIASNDVLTFPSIVIGINEKTEKDEVIPIFYGIYNQLKQDYVSSRYILFEGIEESETYTTHFSDRKVLLYSTLDYRRYGLWIEKIKMSYLSSYSIFDKIAYLINIYFKFGIPNNRVNFRTIWYVKSDPKKGLNPELKKSKNWPLLGLYWLSKDLYYKESSDLMKALEPDAQEINTIRNHIAHKYLTVHHDDIWKARQHRELNDNLLSYPVGDKELIRKTLKLLKLVRNALVYVSLSAHWNEEEKPRDKKDILFPSSMHIMDDTFK